MKFSVLKLRDFRVLLISRMMFMTAWVAQDWIISWQVYSITKSAFILGLTGLAEAVPAIICALFAGHIVDISRPYIIMLGCVGTLVLDGLVLTLVGGSYVYLPGGIVVWLFIGIFISGMARSFMMPASFSLLSQVVARADMPAASAFMTSGFQIASISGRVLAGLFYGGFGVRIAWLMPVSLMVVALFLYITGISEKPRKWRSGEKREPAVKSIKAGWSFIFSNRVLLSIMALDMFAVLFGGAVSMIPAFGDQVLHVGAREVGLLSAAPAVGAVIVALTLAVRPLKIIRGSLLLKVVVGFGICMIGFGLSKNMAMAMFFLAVSGAFDSVSMVVRQTLMQWLTPDTMRGRVSAVNSMFIVSSNEIGSFESGTAAKLLGLVPSIILGGVGTLGVVLITAFAAPKLRKLEVRAGDNQGK